MVMMPKRVPTLSKPWHTAYKELISIPIPVFTCLETWMLDYSTLGKYTYLG